MATKIDLTLDCAAPVRLAEFWKTVLGYEDEPPPAPYKTREEWLQQFDDEFDDGMEAAWLHDPSGAGPRLSLLQVPEPKERKNRLHMDVRVSRGRDPAERWTLVTAEVARLKAAGATAIAEFDGHHVVLADPEGNEFCVC
jgi:hypothetical protein